MTTTATNLHTGDYIACPTDGIVERVVRVARANGRVFIRTSRHDHASVPAKRGFQIANGHPLGEATR